MNTFMVYTFRKITNENLSVVYSKMKINKIEKTITKQNKICR